MGMAVIGMADGRGHIDHSFDEFRLLQVRHRVVAALELGAREPIAVLQWRDLLRCARRGCRCVGDALHGSLTPPLRHLYHNPQAKTMLRAAPAPLSDPPSRSPP